jgi:hypothetical protein
LADYDLAIVSSRPLNITRQFDTLDTFDDRSDAQS